MTPRNDVRHPSSDSPNTRVTVEVRDHIATIRIGSGSGRLNLLTTQLRSDLRWSLEQCDGSEEVNVIVLTGNERGFVAGSDVRELQSIQPDEMYETGHFEWWNAIRRVRTPIVAAVTGHAIGGGCELMLACDLIVLARSAQLAQPEITLGIMPGGGGTQRLARVAGRASASEWLLTGRPFTAEEARSAGLVNAVVADEEVLPTAFELAGQIARNPRMALRLTKEAIATADEVGMQAGLNHERRNFELLFGTPQAQKRFQALYTDPTT